jgi:hypothetical protein
LHWSNSAGTLAPNTTRQNFCFSPSSCFEFKFLSILPTRNFHPSSSIFRSFPHHKNTLPGTTSQRPATSTITAVLSFFHSEILPVVVTVSRW